MRHPHEQQPKVLVVEDDRLNRLVVSRMISRIELRKGESQEASPPKPVEAESGEAAVQVLSTQQIDLVLMDIELPGMNGLETTRAIRSGAAGAGASKIPVIAMSAHNSEEDRLACLDSGMTDYLTKPLSLSLLSNAVSQALCNGSPDRQNLPGEN